jgi:hypothetical protein
MLTRRDFLGRGIAAVAGAAILSSAAAQQLLANHKNSGVPQSRTKEMLKDGSGGGTPDGHSQNHGEMSLRTEGNPVLGGTCTDMGAGAMDTTNRAGGTQRKGHDT